MKPSTTRRSMRRTKILRIVGVAVSVVLAAVTIKYVVPRFADLSEIWAGMQAMTWRELGVLALVAAANVAIAAAVLLAATPGLTYWQAVVVNETSTAVSNTVPGGTAIAIGLVYKMLGSWGFSKSRRTLSITLSGLWNISTKLAIAVLAVVLLVVQGDVTRARLIVGAIAAGVLVAIVVLVTVVLRHEDLAIRAGEAAGRMSLRLRRRLNRHPTNGWGRATAKFRGRVIGVIDHRWIQVTVSAVAGYLTLYLVLLVTLRAVGVANDEVGWTDALAVLAVMRLVTVIPLSPGGIGIVEFGLISGLTSAGGDRAEVVTAVLVYRILTYAPPIALGIATYLYWRHNTSWRDTAPPLDPPLTSAAWPSAEAA
jgi:putative heme transporter